MSAQSNDTLTFEGRDFEVTGVSRGLLFDPAGHGFRPVSTSTSCHQGYECRYSVDARGLMLQKLWINYGEFLDDGTFKPFPMPEFNGVVANENRNDPDVWYFSAVYSCVNLALDYTGELLVSADNLSDEGYFRGYPLTWHFNCTLKLSFENGRLVGRKDLSDVMKIFDARYCREGYLYGDGRRNGLRFLRRQVGGGFRF